LGEKFVEILRLVIAHYESAGPETYTPKDFPLSRLSEQQLEKVLAKLGKRTD